MAAQASSNLANGITAQDMSVAQVKAVLAASLDEPSTVPPVFLWGPMGVGKSAAPKQVACEYGVELIDFRALLHDTVDLLGLPYAATDDQGGKFTAWATPRFLPRDGQGILFLDEVLLSEKQMQGALYQLILDRAIGDYCLPKGWLVAAASNRMTDRAGVQAMLTPLRNRFTHVHVVADMDSWTSWALAANIRVEVIAFLRYRPGLLFQFDPSKNEYAFATPRSWEFVSMWLNRGLPSDVEFGVLSGTVGEGCAAEFLGFLKIYRKLPSPDSIMLNPTTAEVPTDPATLYALSGALSKRATDQTFDRILQYCKRMPAEFSVLTVRDCIARDKTLTNTKAFITWASQNSSVLL